jgi:hypothetical protein
VKTRDSLQKRDHENEIMEELNFSSMGEINRGKVEKYGDSMENMIYRDHNK